MFTLSCIHGAGTRRFHLIVCLRTQPSTIGCGASSKVSELLLHAIRFCFGGSHGRSGRWRYSRGCRRTRSFATARYTNSQKEEKEYFLHDFLIVMEALCFS